MSSPAIWNLKSQIKRSVALDIFAGSNTTGSAAEKLDRRWMAFEKDRTYLAASAFRFVDELPTECLAGNACFLKWRATRRASRTRSATVFAPGTVKTAKILQRQ